MKFGTYLETIAGISVYPLISLITFVLFFLLVTWWMYSLDADEIKKIENLPFEQ